MKEQLFIEVENNVGTKDTLLIVSNFSFLEHWYQKSSDAEASVCGKGLNPTRISYI